MYKWMCWIFNRNLLTGIRYFCKCARWSRNDWQIFLWLLILIYIFFSATITTNSSSSNFLRISKAFYRTIMEIMKCHYLNIPSHVMPSCLSHFLVKEIFFLFLIVACERHSINWNETWNWDCNEEAWSILTCRMFVTKKTF